MILDVLVEPNQPVINYRTSITGLDSRVLHLSNATPLSDIQVGSRLFSSFLLVFFVFFFFAGHHHLVYHFAQEKLLGLLPTGTIMVGHLLNKDLKGTIHLSSLLFHLLLVCTDL